MHPSHASRVAFAAKYVSEKHPDMIAICGSDYHDKGSHGTGLMLTKTVPTNSYELADLLRTKDYYFDVYGYIVVPPHK